MPAQGRASVRCIYGLVCVHAPPVKYPPLKSLGLALEAPRPNPVAGVRIVVPVRATPALPTFVLLDAVEHRVLYLTGGG